MSRIANVYEALASLTKEHGISAGELAEHLGLARSNVSGDLNRLCDEGKASKQGTKPVLYHALAERSLPKDSVLDRLAERSPSLCQAVEQAKAAVLYPPRGMPMLLLGETGVGKSMFAELVHGYAIEVGRLGTGAPFVVFNCADYASNPQLLVSYLFGARKGAFTGADADRPGLIERADGGILFLDEVHRLPPEGQEMLFSFFDRGCYRRLGDSDTERRADVLIIAATTESPSSALLRTFTRRIPMAMSLPPLSERSIEERLSLARAFFAGEAARLGKPINVTVNAVRALLGYLCPNNVGQLKSDIQLLCARAYSDLITQRKEKLEIATADLPSSIKAGLVAETSHRKIWNLLPDMGCRFLVFSERADEEEACLPRKGGSQTIYDFIDLRTRSMRERGLGEDEIGRELDDAIKAFFVDSCGGWRSERISELVGEDVERAILEMVDLAQRRLGRNLSASISSGLAIHVMSAIKRVRAGKRIESPDFDRIRKEHPEEFDVAVDCLKIIDREFAVSMPLDESGFIATFFALDAQSLAPRSRPAVVVMAHGESTASSMVKACNDLLGEEVAVGIDVPLDENPQDAYAVLRSTMAERSPGSDLFLLVDMGSLTNFGADLALDLGIAERTVPLASTLHVLQASRKAIMGLSLDEIYNDVLKVDEMLARKGARQAAGTVAETIPELRRGCIITLCVTGEGTAAFIKSRLEELVEPDKASVEIVAVSIPSVAGARGSLEALERKKGRIYCIVSPFKLGLGYKEFGIEDVLDRKGLAAIGAFVEGEILFDKIVEAHRDSLTAVDPRLALEGARSLVTAVEAGLGCQLLSGPRVGAYCHIAAMIDRAARGEAAASFPDKAHFLAENEDAVALVRNELYPMQCSFSIRISDDEVCYLVSFFHPDNCNRPVLGAPGLFSASADAAF